MQPVILVVEADVSIADLTRQRLELNGMEASVYYDHTKALPVALAKEPDVIICDIGLGSSDALEFAEAVLQTLELCKVLLTSGARLPLAAERLLTEYESRSAFLRKPFAMEVLMNTLEELLLR